MAPEILNRRRFLKAGTITALGSGLPAASQAQAKDRGPADLLRAGIILGGGNHAMNMWARLLNTTPDTNNITHTP
ncbi:MAG: twin-arginine translocation signal domain-containing protein, partial [Candidatus Latescibacteria bacterium]|nr:twin-arginine translocation signal domain-containing protein [Candidatus Latescibacterota bacterium]